MAAQRPMSSFLQASKRLKVNGEAKVVIATGANPRFSKPIANRDNSLMRKGSSRKSSQEMRSGSKRISSKQSYTTTVKNASAVPTEQSSVRHESAGESARDWSQEETLQIELAKVATHATNIRSICEERVAEAQAQGKPFPDIRDLIVDQRWKGVLQGEFDKEYMMALTKFLSQEASGPLPIYPPPAMVFNALNSCPFEAVKVVILGQDPYHGPGQAMGLSFSVPIGNKVPSSLVNIYKEIRADLGCAIPSHGNLEKWAYQGVLLLNAVLTVRERQANSHARKGWEAFTDAAIRAVSQQRTAVVFLLWGNSAQEKIRLVDTTKHHILKAAHPSGFSAHKGFFGCRHFSQANELLMQAGHLPIDWQL